MKSLITGNKWFFIPFVIWVLAVGILLTFTDKLEFFLWLNQFHDSSSDAIFAFVTHLPELWGHVVVIIGSFFIRIRYGLLSGFTMALAGISSAVLKTQVFGHMMRPTATDFGVDLNVVEGVKLAKMFSFPSGHTSAAFALAVAATFILAKRKKWLGFIMFLLAVAVGYSRIHLCQHFPIDVYAGSILGTLCGLVVFTVGNRIFNSLSATWPDRSVLSLFTRIAP